MSLNRYNPRRDSGIEAEIVQTLRQLGCKVFRLSGPGIPDLAVYSRGHWVLAEIKQPKGRLALRQREWGPEVLIWRSLPDALQSLGIAVH